MVLVIISAFIIEKDFSNQKFNYQDIQKFEKILFEKEKKAENKLNEINAALLKENNLYLNRIIRKNAGLFKKEGIALFLYNNDSLVNWTTNGLPVPERIDLFPDGDIISLHNFVCLKKDLVSSPSHTLISLILIRSDYPYKNKILKEGFQEKFKLSPGVKIILPGTPKINPVYNRDGKFLFSFDFSMAKKENKLKSFICQSLYLTGFFLFLLFLLKIIKNSYYKRRNYVILFISLILFAFYFFIQKYRVPVIIFEMGLFSPQKFAHSSYLPSLGNLMVLVILIFFVIYNFHLEFSFNLAKLKSSLFYRFILFLFAGPVVLLLFYAQNYIFQSLVLDSSISFETNKVLDISVYTFIGFLINALIFVSYSILLDKFFGIYLAMGYRIEALIFLVFINILAIFFYFIPGFELYPENIIFFLVITLLIYYNKIIRDLKYRISTYLIFVFLISVYTVLQVRRFAEVRAISDMKITAVNLSSEHDPIAELLFVEISEKIGSDNELESLLFSPDFDFKTIYSEIQRKYFSGYLDKYDLQITLCRPSDRVYIHPPDDRWEHCYSFFFDVIMQDAVEVSNSNFYFLNNLNGRVSYFSPVTFKRKRNEITLFIELDSKLLSEGLGYPELLLDENLYNISKTKYSYAKYYQGKLITSSGQYSYSMSSSSYTTGDTGFEVYYSDEYNHVVYNIDKGNTIIVTTPVLLFIDLIIAFSYIFVFYFFILIALLYLTDLSPLATGIQWNFKNKIQLTISSVIFISVLLIGAGTVNFSIRQYRMRQVENLKEKIQSVYSELINRLDFAEDLNNWSSESYYNLEFLLQRLSNVFYTDINLYDKSGWLLASSRPEIFENGLIGRNINTAAGFEMIENQRSEFFHNETIGSLNYLSAYVPFVSSDNKLLAYLNLPYFTRQDELTMEMANLVVAIINILVLFTLFSLAISVFISNTLTQPLRLIQEHISRFSLNMKNEKISYKSRDEIGSLINEYNMMVDQLSESAEKLARSERESAWREMAKQVAHEIKNPLTPMRLILQHLQRSWKEDTEIREEQQKKLSKILLEQIDQLSKIANEFSNFAKMPVSHNEKTDIRAIVTNVVKLFEKSENTSIEIKDAENKELYIWADKEQISRVFINLLKNAIQSFPDERPGKIEIELMQNEKKVIVKVSDNGKGIPPEIRDKLFQPNFTTKTSGMGMGLAIAKNIVVSCEGDIYYETEINKGSTFTVELPLLIE